MNCFAQTTRVDSRIHISNLHRDDNRNKHTCSDQQNVDFFYFIFLKDTERGFPSLLVGSQHKIQHPTNQETLNNDTEGEAGGEGRKNLPRRCSSPRACGLRNPPPATKPDKSNQSSTDSEREPKRKHKVEGRGADLGDVDRGGHQGGGPICEARIGEGGGGRTLSPAKAPATTKVT